MHWVLEQAGDHLNDMTNSHSLTCQYVNNGRTKLAMFHELLDQNY